jgi:transcriptional regulator with XRE-family HTH domain
VGLTTTEAAGRVNVHANTILRWERRERLPGPAHMRGLATAYRIPVADVARFFDVVRAPAEVNEGSPGWGLRPLRHAHGLSATQLGARLGVPAHTIYNWEAGRARVPRDVLAVLGRALKAEAPTLELLLRCRPQSGQPERTGPRTRLPSTTLRRLRQRAGLSQVELARQAGVGLSSLKGWERGPAPTLQGVRGLARALDLPAVSLARALEVRLPRELDPGSWRAGDLPRVLRVLRQWSQLTQAELSSRCRVSLSTVRAWERGQSCPGRESRERLECLYRLPTGALVVGYPSYDPSPRRAAACVQGRTGRGGGIRTRG